MITLGADVRPVFFLVAFCGSSLKSNLSGSSGIAVIPTIHQDRQASSEIPTLWYYCTVSLDIKQVQCAHFSSIRCELYLCGGKSHPYVVKIV